MSAFLLNWKPLTIHSSFYRLDDKVNRTWFCFILINFLPILYQFKLHGLFFYIIIYTLTVYIYTVYFVHEMYS